MSERKVLNKYIPPDFDPERMTEKKKLLKKIEKRRNKEKNKNTTKKNLMNIRMMYPFTLQCSKCKGFTYVGTKFNSRVEKVPDEHYLNIPIWRFYGKCNDCRNEIIFKTDPKNGDYVLVSGGVRTYDAHKEQEVADNFYRETSIIKEENRIENTEKQSYDAMMELKRNEQLEELQNINKRNADKINTINKALLHLSEKKVNEKNKDFFYMNNMDPEDEKAFFELINKQRVCNDHYKNQKTKMEENTLEEIIEEEEEQEEEQEKIEKIKKEEDKEMEIEPKKKAEKEEETVDEKNKTELLKLANQRKSEKINYRGCAPEQVKKKAEMSNNDKDTDSHTEKGNDKNLSDLKNKLIIKKRNLASEYNFVVKKKEDFCSMLNEYNSSDDSSHEFA